MTELKIDQKVLAGQNGDGVLIEEIDLKSDTSRDGKEFLRLEMRGTAVTVLKDRNAPKAGFDDLPYPVPVIQSIDLLKEDADNQQVIAALNKTFEFKKPLVDRPGEMDRLLEGEKDSVFGEIIGKPAYFYSKLKQGKEGTDISHYWVNIVALPKRLKADKATVEATKKRIRAAAEAKERELEEALAG